MKNSELHGFYELYPEKFNNKTNGITFRRWLLDCDPAPDRLHLEQLIGSGFRKDADRAGEAAGLSDDDEAMLEQLHRCQGLTTRRQLADWLLAHPGRDA